MPHLKKLIGSLSICFIFSMLLIMSLRDWDLCACEGIFSIYIFSESYAGKRGAGAVNRMGDGAAGRAGCGPTGQEAGFQP